jgi:hypothetical protein
VLTAALFAVAGWLIIPARRRRLIRELEAKIATLSADLSSLLAAKFEEQLSRYEQQLLEVLRPYERFLETEAGKLDAALRGVGATQLEVDALARRVTAAFE